MKTGLLIFSNLFAPLITGLFFFLYFIYFIIANPSKAASYRFFIIFLIGFSIFLFGRPLQLILGPYPLPLIIVNIRVFVLCSVISPAIILAADVFNTHKRKHNKTCIALACLFLGLTYGVFNTLGTRGSYTLFEFAGLTAHDNLTPSMQLPFYGREVTIGVQVITGTLLFLFSVLKLVKLKIDTPPRHLFRNKIFLINIGIVIFAFSFIIGSLFKQWWIYYATSIVSALLFGGSVLIDIKEVHNYYEKLIPFIKEDILHNVAFSEFSKIKLMEMLTCLGKKTNLNTFIIIKIKEKNPDLSYDIGMIDEVLGTIHRCLNIMFSEDCFLLLPLSDTKFGIVLRLSEEPDSGEHVHILEVLEDIQKEINKKCRCSLAMGIGRSYEKIEDLRISYHEASNAQEFAGQFDSSSIIHVENIHEADRYTNKYPVKEKEKLLSLLKVGDVEGSRKALGEFITRFKLFIEEKPEVLKMRLYELIGSFIDSAILGGGDEDRLNEQVLKYINDITFIKDLEIAEKWLAKVVSEIANSVVHVYERRSKTLIEKAKQYIEAHYQSQLSYKDVAKNVFISPSYFLNLFKQETGTTFVDYLTTVRINRAKKLLLSSELSITQIAYEIGFNSSNYFSSLFRKTVGTSAKEYRSKGAELSSGSL